VERSQKGPDTLAEPLSLRRKHPISRQATEGTYAAEAWGGEGGEREGEEEEESGERRGAAASEKQKKDVRLELLDEFATFSREPQWLRERLLGAYGLADAAQHLLYQYKSTCFTSTKVQILTLLSSVGAYAHSDAALHLCSTSTTPRCTLLYYHY
jgi:hypothetical protein